MICGDDIVSRGSSTTHEVLSSLERRGVLDDEDDDSVEDRREGKGTRGSSSLCV